MDTRELLEKVDEILDIAKVAVLATVREDGSPCVRWMTPAILKGRPGVLFTLTAPGLGKVCHINAKADVEWMIQTPSLTQVVNLRGKVNIVDNPSLKKEILESIGARLSSFWQVTGTEPGDFIVLETIIEEGTYYRPMHGVKKTVSFIREVANG